MDGEEKKEEVLGLEWHSTGVVYCWELHIEKSSPEGSNLKAWQFSSVLILSSFKEEEDTSLIDTYLQHTPHMLGHTEPSTVTENLEFTNNVNT